jgi:hypothetical protein
VISRIGLVNPRARNRGNRTPDHALGEYQWRPSDLARELGMSRNLFNQWIRRGWISAQREPGRANRWIVTAGPTEIDRLRQLRALPVHTDRNTQNSNNPALQNQQKDTTMGQSQPDDRAMPGRTPRPR